MDTANVHYILHRQQTENAYIAASNTSIYIQFQNKVLVNYLQFAKLPSTL